jgi:hypothetical protein
MMLLADIFHVFACVAWACHFDRGGAPGPDCIMGGYTNPR